MMVPTSTGGAGFLFPMRRAELLRIEYRRIELHICANVSVVLGKYLPAIGVHLHPGRNPSSVERLIAREANVIKFAGIAARGLNFAHEQQCILLHPELPGS